MAAGRTGAHAGAEGSWHHRRTARPAGAGDDEHAAGGTFRTARTEHAVVMAERVVTPANHCASEEDDRHDENDSGDDHHPRGDLVQPRRPR
jgi:hypothetical protein